MYVCQQLLMASVHRRFDFTVIIFLASVSAEFPTNASNRETEIGATCSSISEKELSSAVIPPEKNEFVIVLAAIR